MSFFQSSEFDSPDAPGSGVNMNSAFVLKLETARRISGFPWTISAGYRTPSHNAAIGGAGDSWHMKGMAADIACTDGIKRFAIVAAAIQAGIKGIEVCDRHVHLDARDTPYMWPDKSK